MHSRTIATFEATGTILVAPLPLSRPPSPTNSDFHVRSPTMTTTKTKTDERREKYLAHTMDHRGSPSPRHALSFSFFLSLSLSLFFVPLAIPLPRFSLSRSLSVRTVRDEKRGTYERATIGRNSCWWRPREVARRSRREKRQTGASERDDRAALYAITETHAKIHRDGSWRGMIREFLLVLPRRCRRCRRGCKDNGLTLSLSLSRRFAMPSPEGGKRDYDDGGGRKRNGRGARRARAGGWLVRGRETGRGDQ